MTWYHDNDGINAWIDQRLPAATRGWHHATRRGLSRRRLMQLLAASGAAATWVSGRRRSVWAQTAPEPELVLKPTPPEHFFDYGLNKEMRWETMAGRGYLVPNDLFFVRNHTRTPRLDVATWRLKVEGSGVERPLELRYDDLLAMPELSVIRCIECAGNGRSFFQVEHGRKAPGTQWKLGAIGVAEWTGVPLRRAGWAVRNGRHGWTEEHAETPEPTRNVLLGECAVLLWAADHAGVVAMAHNALAPDGLLRQ